MNSAVPEDALLVLRERLVEQDPALPDEGTAPASLKHELRGLLTLSAPVMVQLSAQYAVTVINQYFIGHQGAGPLAAAAIGNTVRQLVTSSGCDQLALPILQSGYAVVQRVLVLFDGRFDRSRHIGQPSARRRQSKRSHILLRIGHECADCTVCASGSSTPCSRSRIAGCIPANTRRRSSEFGCSPRQLLQYDPKIRA